MTSPMLILALMAAAVHAAPQINQRQVVGSVMAQLQPAIRQALSELNLGSSSSTFPAATFPAPSSSPSWSHSHVGSSPHATSSGLSSGMMTSSMFSPRISSGMYSRSYSPVMSSGMSSPSYSPGMSSAMSSKMITSQVVSQLQPAITAAVSEALKVSSRKTPNPWSGPWVAPLGAVNSPTAPISRILPSTRTYVPTRRLTQLPVTSLATSGKSDIVSSVLRSLRPKITSVVRSAMASSRPATASRGSSSINELFGAAGENSVRIEQAGNTIEY